MAVSRFNRYQPTKYQSQFVPKQLPQDLILKGLQKRQKKFDNTLKAANELGLDFNFLPYSRDPEIANKLVEDFEGEVDSVKETISEGNISEGVRKIRELKRKKKDLMSSQGKANLLQKNYEEFHNNIESLKDRYKKGKLTSEGFKRRKADLIKKFEEQGGSFSEEGEFQELRKVHPDERIDVQQRATDIADEKAVNTYTTGISGQKIKLGGLSQILTTEGKIKTNLSGEFSNLTQEEVDKAIGKYENLVRGSIEQDPDVISSIKESYRQERGVKEGEDFNEYLDRKLDEASKRAVDTKLKLSRTKDYSTKNIPDSGSGDEDTSPIWSSPGTSVQQEVLEGKPASLYNINEGITNLKEQGKESKAEMLRNRKEKYLEELDSIPSEQLANRDIPVPEAGSWGEAKEGLEGVLELLEPQGGSALPDDKLVSKTLNEKGLTDLAKKYKKETSETPRGLLTESLYALTGAEDVSRVGEDYTNGNLAAAMVNDGRDPEEVKEIINNPEKNSDIIKDYKDKFNRAKDLSNDYNEAVKEYLSERKIETGLYYSTNFSDDVREHTEELANNLTGNYKVTLDSDTKKKIGLKGLEGDDLTKKFENKLDQTSENWVEPQGYQTPGELVDEKVRLNANVKHDGKTKNVTFWVEPATDDKTNIREFESLGNHMLQDIAEGGKTVSPFTEERLSGKDAAEQIKIKKDIKPKYEKFKFGNRNEIGSIYSPVSAVRTSGGVIGKVEGGDYISNLEAFRFDPRRNLNEVAKNIVNGISSETPKGEEPSLKEVFNIVNAVDKELTKMEEEGSVNYDNLDESIDYNKMSESINSRFKDQRIDPGILKGTVKALNSPYKISNPNLNNIGILISMGRHFDQ